MIDRVAVLGGGFMGAGIAEVAAIAGCAVVVRDVSERDARRARDRVEGSLDAAVAGGKLSPEQAASALSRVSFTDAADGVADADLIVEAVPEDTALKVAVIADVARATSPGAIIASNTSSIPIASLAAATDRPERVLGLHFFSPVPVMKLVEVVVAIDTDPRVVGEACAFVQRLGKTPIQTKDRSGFVVNMLLVPYLMAAVAMYEEGFAPREAIDDAMRLGCGHPMGPLALCDFIGLDVLHAVCESLHDEFKRPEYAPPPLMKRMIASGRLGRKSGRGFYEYADSLRSVLRASA